MPKGHPSHNRQEFQGVAYYQTGDNPYYWARNTKFRGSGVSLHVSVWEHHFGPRPEGYVIHHKDENPANCDITNLELMLEADHARLHTKARHARGNLKPPSARALALAAAWHRSPEGLAWHREHAKEAWKDPPKGAFACVHCKTLFVAVRKTIKRGFCSMACQSAARRASGVDDETRICAWCESPFQTNKYAKIKTCSRSCGVKLARSG